MFNNKKGKEKSGKDKDPNKKQKKGFLGLFTKSKKSIVETPTANNREFDLENETEDQKDQSKSSQPNQTLLATNKSQRSSKKGGFGLGLFSITGKKKDESKASLMNSKKEKSKSSEKKNVPIPVKAIYEGKVFQKKGKKPKPKAVIKKIIAKNIGNVQRVKNKFYPGNLDYKYSPPKEDWVPLLGQNKTIDSLDFGDSARIIMDEAFI